MEHRFLELGRKRALRSTIHSTAGVQQRCSATRGRSRRGAVSHALRSSARWICWRQVCRIASTPERRLDELVGGRACCRYCVGHSTLSIAAPRSGSGDCVQLLRGDLARNVGVIFTKLRMIASVLACRRAADARSAMMDANRQSEAMCADKTLEVRRCADPQTAVRKRKSSKYY